jgi:hypothetical protein
MILYSPRWEDLEDRADRCPKCLHWFVSHGVPGEDGYECSVIESGMAERAAMAERDRELQRQGVPPEAAGLQAYRELRYCGCTFADGNGVTPRQVRIWSDGTSWPLAPWQRADCGHTRRGPIGVDNSQHCLDCGLVLVSESR